MSAKRLPDQFDNYDPEKIGKGLADITKEIVEKDELRKKGVTSSGKHTLKGVTSGKHIENTQRTPSEHTENIKNTKQAGFEHFKKTDLITFSIRLRMKDKKRLKQHFNNRDIGLSQGIRIIIKDYMERQGI